MSKNKTDRTKEYPNKDDVEVLGPDVGYVELINHGTEELIKKRNKSWGMPLRPSAAGKCEKELGYELMEYRGYAEFEKEVMQPNVHRLLSLGHSIETNFIWQIKNAMREIDPSFSIKYNQQVLDFGELDSGERLEGQIDSVFVSEKFKALIDYKSKKNKFASFFKDDWEATAEKLRTNPYCKEFGEESFYIFDLEQYLEYTRQSDPFTAMNFYQLNLYYHDNNNFLRSRGIDHCALLYYCKNDSRIREIRFKPSEAVADYVKNKYKKIQESVDKHKDTRELNKEFTLGNVKCAFCDFNKDCWKDTEKDALQAFFDTFPNKRWAKDTAKMDKTLANEMETLYTNYAAATEASIKQKEFEQAILLIMDKHKVYKVKFSDGLTYDMKSYKSGGVGGGPRLALKRSK